jgi:hypothetical protein
MSSDLGHMTENHKSRFVCPVNFEQFENVNFEVWFKHNLMQCFSTAGPLPGTGPWH